MTEQPTAGSFRRNTGSSNFTLVGSLVAGIVSSGGEEHAESVVLEVAVAVGEAAGLLDQHVDRLSAAVADAAGVQVGQDLRPTGAQGPAEPRNLRDRAGREGRDDLLCQRAPRLGRLWLL